MCTCIYPSSNATVAARPKASRMLFASETDERPARVTSYCVEYEKSCNSSDHQVVNSMRTHVHKKDILLTNKMSSTWQELPSIVVGCFNCLIHDHGKPDNSEQEEGSNKWGLVPEAASSAARVDRMRGEPGWGALERVSRYLPTELYPSCSAVLGVCPGTSLHVLIGVAVSGQRAAAVARPMARARGCETQVACVCLPR